MTARIAAVRALHEPSWPCRETCLPVCETCGHRLWPCETANAVYTRDQIAAMRWWDSAERVETDALRREVGQCSSG